MEVLAQKSTPSGGARQQKTETHTFKKAVDAFLKGNLAYVAEYVQDGNPVLQFNGKILITNELISYVSAFAKLDQRIVDLVKSGVDLDASFDNGEGYTAVHFAAWDGKDEILAYLLEAGASADLVGEDGYTPLFLAAAGGHLDCVEILVENGADVNRRLKDNNIYFSKQGGTPLTVAFINGFLGMALYLIDQGADPFVLKEPCQNAPSPDLFVNFSSLLKQGAINLPREGQLETILSLVGKDGEQSDAEVEKGSGSLDLNDFLAELESDANEEESNDEEEEEDTNLDEVIKKFIEKQGSDNILELLDQDYSQKGDIVVVKIDADDLINTLSTTDHFGDFVYITGIIQLNSDTVWADLAGLIGESEVDWVKSLVQMENPDTIVLFYCGENYVYAFSNMNANENINGEDTSEEEAVENKGISDLTNFLAELEAVTREEESIDDDSEEEDSDEDDDESEEEVEDEEEEGGFPMISYRKPAQEMVEVVQQYLRHWQKSSQVYAWRMGIKAFIPEFVSALVSDKVCPIFTTKDIDAICSRIKSEKIIPILGYVPEEFYGYTKRVWWLVPFCIWKEDTASLVFIDKNGFYGMYSQDGEEEIDTIFNWDSVYELDFEYAYDGDPNINRLTLTQEDGNFLTFDEFVSTSEEDDHGSYLAVIEAIWEARRETIEASKGEPFWTEGAGGEGFVEFETPQDLLKAATWDNPDRPDPSMFGG
jgi:ankyrin repeat protein